VSKIKLLYGKLLKNGIYFPKRAGLGLKNQMLALNFGQKFLQG
jgi:hypothetical protein